MIYFLITVHTISTGYYIYIFFILLLSKYNRYKSSNQFGIVQIITFTIFN